MLDLVYIVVALAFFGVMLAYVAGCDRLGRGTDVERGTEEAR